MTAVTIRPTFGKKERVSNGLEEIADDLLKNQFEQHYVVGLVQFAGGSLGGPGEPITPAVKFHAIEPLTGADAERAKEILDAARTRCGLGLIEDTLFSVPKDGEGFDFEGPDGGEGGSEMEGQEALPIRMGADGEHEVPPPSPEEVAAELAEARAAGVPAAEFSGGKA